MTDTTTQDTQNSSTEQLQCFGVYLDLFCQDVLPMQTDRYQYQPLPVHPRFIRSWYVFQSAKTRYVTPIASQRLYKSVRATANDSKQTQLKAYDAPFLWMCDDGRLVVNWLEIESTDLVMQLKFASGADLRSMDAHGLQRVIYQLGIAVSAQYDDMDEFARLQQELLQLNQQSDQAVLAQR